MLRTRWSQGWSFNLGPGVSVIEQAGALAAGAGVGASCGRVAVLSGTNTNSNNSDSSREGVLGEAGQLSGTQDGDGVDNGTRVHTNAPDGARPPHTPTRRTRQVLAARE